MLECATAPDRSSARHAPDVTELLADLRAGRREALDEMLPVVYQELRRAARRELALRPSETLSATALVNELYLKLAGVEHAAWCDRAHFLAVAAIAMRHILVDRARRRMAKKRRRPDGVALSADLVAVDGDAESLLELHDALDRLAALDARLARVVECRFFGGMTEQETAEALQVTERTVRRDWVKARALLYHALTPDAHDARTGREPPVDRRGRREHPPAERRLGRQPLAQSVRVRVRRPVAAQRARDLPEAGA
jgi:RNA polymerase sigma factor (TIGR02999 family)